MTTTAKGPSDIVGHITRHIYDEGGALRSVYSTPEGGGESCYLQDIHYNAKRQRRWIWYGSATKTKYTYDPDTFRLTRLHTINLNPSLHDILQDLNKLCLILVQQLLIPVHQLLGPVHPFLQDTTLTLNRFAWLSIGVQSVWDFLVDNNCTLLRLACEWIGTTANHSNPPRLRCSVRQMADHSYWPVNIA